MASLSLCSLASRASSPNRFAASTTFRCASMAFNRASLSGIGTNSLTSPFPRGQALLGFRLRIRRRP